MTLRRIVSFFSIFSLGAFMCWSLLRLTNTQTVSAGEAQRRALLLLDHKSIGMSIGDNHIVAAVKCIEPAVVNIDTMGRMKAGETGVGTVYVDQEVHGKGSGVIITPDGYILTNNHVIEDANRIRVTLSTGQWYYAHRIGEDPQTDLAVIRIEAANLPTAEFGDSDSLQVGEWSIAVGNPLGLGSTVTVGIISALNRHNLQVEEGRKLEGAIQTDAAINRGNSGGALADINGKLIGINTAILSAGSGGGSIGLGFAIPANNARRIARELIANGKAAPVLSRQPWLGISYGAVPEGIGQSLGLSPYRGVLIRRVLPESPASLAGLESNDIVLMIDGKEIGEERDVRDAVQQRRIGEKARLRVLRAESHRQEDVSVTLQEKPQDPPPTP
jgi:S1-C subfamily serine protease